VGNRLDIGFLERDEFVGEKAERPAVSPGRRVATSKCDEVCFMFTIEFPLVVAVGIATMDRRYPVFAVSFSNSMSSHRAAVEGVSDPDIADALIRFEKDVSPSDSLGTSFTVRDGRFEFDSFIL